jgi:hypothetical protein
MLDHRMTGHNAGIYLEMAQTALEAVCTHWLKKSTHALADIPYSKNLPAAR